MNERSTVQIAETASPRGYTALKIGGVLDSSTYSEIRDCVIEAALAEPTAVLVDVSGLHAPAESAWIAFTSARWHVSVWPDIPVVLVCDHAQGRSSIARSGATRHISVHPDEMAAARSVRDWYIPRRRASADLATTRERVRRARTLLSRWLAVWDRSEMVVTASTVASILVENTLVHTTGGATLILEAIDDHITVAVSDGSRTPAARHEDSTTGAHTVSGLAIVSALSRSWGCTPTASGKTVWALIGPENRL